MTLDPSLAAEDYCYLTTTGRVTGKPHEIEIWFGLSGTRLYMLAGGRDRTDWVRNLRRQPRVTIRIRDRAFTGLAGLVTHLDEDALARRLLVEKYTAGYSGNLSGWGRTALPVYVDLDGGP